MSAAPALLMAAIAAAPVVASADDATGYYEGSIEAGRRSLAVGLDLVADGSTVSGVCFYSGSKGADIQIQGTLQADGTVRLEETNEQGKVTGVWSGRVAGGAIKGDWQNPKTGQRWPFTLAAREARGRYVAEPVTVATAGTAGRLSYRMTEAPVTGKVVPQITQLADRRAMHAVNRHLMAVARAATCGGAPNDYELAAGVAYAAQDVFSVRVRASWFCGGPYPTTDADRSATFDLKTGALVDMASLFQGATPQAINEAFYAYEIAQLQHRAGVSKDDPDSCLARYEPADLARTESSFHFSNDGLVVRPEYAHAFEACAHEVTVPYRALAALAAPGGALARVAAAHQAAPLRYRIHLAGTKPEQDELFTPPGQ